MSRLPRLFGLLSLMLLVVAALALATGGTNNVQAAPTYSAVLQACDPSGSVNGTAQPSTVLPGDVITFTVTGFRSGEEVSYWFTTPSGDVFGTAQPRCCAPPSGQLIFIGTSEFTRIASLEPGRWALTVQGAQSQHTAVVYFCVVLQIQPTNTPVPPTNTPVPPTATSAPATATSPPATPTIAATVVTTPTVVIEATPTVPIPATSVPTIEPTTAPPPPTAMPTAEATATVPTTEPPVTPGMPRTGQNELALYLLLASMALGLLSVGLAVRKTSRVKR
jgi:hypothetical protein